MINSETFIVKRDGKKEAFSLDKIKNAISKAFYRWAALLPRMSLPIFSAA